MNNTQLTGSISSETCGYL